MDAPLPYPGLRAFTREESYLFFGREGCIDSMIDRLAATRFLAVLGASGSGKSSLVHTGLIDALELGFFAKAGARWTIARCNPGGEPLTNLATALEGTIPPGYPSPLTTGDALRTFLSRGPRSIAEWCDAGGLADGHNLLLIIDQFEELFRYVDYAAREEAEAFVALLLESARAIDTPIYIVLTMRSEYLGACSLIPGLAERVNAGFYLTPRMARAECKQAIEGPAAVAGFTVEPALVNQLLNDMASFAPWEGEQEIHQSELLSRRADQLPLMQHLLNRLWLLARSRALDGKIALTLAQYHEVGGLSGALNIHGEQILQSIDPAYRRDAERVFRALVSGVDTADAVRRPCSFQELAAVVEGGQTAAESIIDRFRADDCNFLQPNRRVPLKSDTCIDISHESLIRQWNELSQWTRDEGRADDRWRELVRRAEREKRGEGSLLTKLDLTSTAAWWDKEQPKKEWADRHGDHYAIASDFFHRSRATANMVRTRKVWIFASAAALILLIVGITYHRRWSVLELLNERQEAEIARLNTLQRQQELIQRSNKQVSHEVDGLGLQQMNLEIDVSNLQGERKNLIAEKNRLAEANTKLNATSAAQESLLSQQTSQIAAQQQRVDAQQQKVDAQLQQIAQQQQQISKLSAAISELSKPAVRVPVTAKEPLVTVYVLSGPAPGEKNRYQLPPEVYIDENPYAFVQPGTYFSVRIPAGQHTLCVADPFSPCESTAFSVEAGGNAQMKVEYVRQNPKRAGLYVSSQGGNVNNAAKSLLSLDKMIGTH